MRPHSPVHDAARLLAALLAAAPALGANDLSSQTSPAGSPAVAANPTAAAQDGAAPDEDSRALRRILTLEGGASVRGIARRNGDTWELKQGAAWQPIPARGVRAVALEKDVVAAFEKDLRAAFRAPEPLAARAKAIAGGFDSGLFQEALDAAEVVLRDHPSDEATRNVLVDRAALFGVPRPTAGPDGALDLEPLLRFASPRGRALREVCVAELARATTGAGQRDALRATVAKELGEVLPRRRSFAALIHGRMFPGEDVRPLMVHALRDAAEDVRGEAARAIGQAGDPGLVLPFVKVLESSPSPTLRRHAAEALGQMGYRSAVEPLVARLSALASSAAQSGGGKRVPHQHIFVGRQFAYIQDFDVEVAQLQSVADPQVNVLVEGKVLDAGVISTIEERQVVAAERASIQRALEALTGERPGGRAKDWIDWWARRPEAASTPAGS